MRGETEDNEQVKEETQGELREEVHELQDYETEESEEGGLDLEE